MYISAPISYPISLLLDYLLGIHTKSRFRNTDLVALIELHTHNALKNLHFHDENDEEHDFNDAMGLNQEQANLMISAIEMYKKKVREKMISLDKSFLFDYQQSIYDISAFTNCGYSRIPIFENRKDNLIGSI